MRMNWNQILLAIGVAGSLAIAGCSSGGSDGPTGPAPFGLAERIAPGDLGFPTGLAQPTPLNRVRAFPALSFSRPVKITHAGDGSDRLFVVEQGGIIRVFDNVDSVATSSVFLDITSKVSRIGNEEGLLGLAFDPDFDTNGFFYVYYSATSPRRSVIAKYTAGVANSEVILLTVPQPFGNHNGGELLIGPDDDKLYVSLGDGGGADDVNNNAQNLDNLLGTVLRLNLDGSAPADNPHYVGDGSARDFIWAHGLRNPWRMSFDEPTGDLWVGDVGQGAFEEIDIVTRGGNYGWRVFEGDAEFNNPTGLLASDFVAPIITYPRSEGIAVTGGLVYRGTALPNYGGAYFYGDFGSGRVWALVWDGANVVSNTEVASVPGPAAFGCDEAGEIYVCAFDGNLYRFEEAGGANAPVVPAALSDAALFSDIATLTPVPGLQEYDVRGAAWADGANVRRWIAVPGYATIGFDASGKWSFPVGTVIVQHFELEGRRVELRVLVNTLSGWEPYSYRWNELGTDADLLDDELTVGIPIAGGTQDWTFPSRADCRLCHNANAGTVLGVRTRQLNRTFPFRDATDNQIRSWNHIGMFSADVGSTQDLPQLGTDARAYLDVNCASCHQPGGPTPVGIDFRLETPDMLMGVIGAPPANTGLNLPDERRVFPGAKESSTLWERMRRRDAFASPPLGTSVLDDNAIDLVGEWIDSLK